MNLGTLALKTWLIILNLIQLVKQEKSLNTLCEMKNVETIKYKKCTSKQKELLNLFSDLSDIILTDETLESESQENEKVESRKEENEKEEMKMKIMKMKMNMKIMKLKMMEMKQWIKTK